MNQVIDFFTGKRTTYGVEVTCIGGQSQLFFEVSATGFSLDHIRKVMTHKFNKIKELETHVTGIDVVHNPSKERFRFSMTFPAGTDILDDKFQKFICRALQSEVEGAI